MPLYEYRCEQCGPFDHRRDAEQANVPVPCPRCEAPARRVYTPPWTRTGPAAGASAAERARVDRALSGEPVVTGRPQGRSVPSRGHRH